MDGAPSREQDVERGRVLEDELAAKASLKDLQGHQRRAAEHFEAPLVRVRHEWHSPLAYEPRRFGSDFDVRVAGGNELWYGDQAGIGQIGDKPALEDIACDGKGLLRKGPVRVVSMQEHAPGSGVDVRDKKRIHSRASSQLCRARRSVKSRGAHNAPITTVSDREKVTRKTSRSF